MVLLDRNKMKTKENKIKETSVLCYARNELDIIESTSSIPSLNNSQIGFDVRVHVFLILLIEIN